MPNIYLGPQGTETLLPDINWIAPGESELPVGYKPNLDKSEQLDGSVRVNFKAYSQKSYSLEWALLPAADVLTLIGLAERKEPLRFQNNWIDATWRWVYVASFDYLAIQSMFAATAKYRASMTLEEIV
jgi:hypothetical protein